MQHVKIMWVYNISIITDCAGYRVQFIECHQTNMAHHLAQGSLSPLPSTASIESNSLSLHQRINNPAYSVYEPPGYPQISSTSHQ